MQRAREYAEALGTTLAALVELADTGAEHPVTAFPPAPGSRMRTASYAAPADDDTAAPLDLEPQRQQVYAAVNARFTMTPRLSHRKYAFDYRKPSGTVRETARNGVAGTAPFAHRSGSPHNSTLVKSPSLNGC